MEDTERHDILIARQLAGELDELGKAELDRWLEADPANRAYFDSMRKLHTLSGRVADSEWFNTDAAWKEVRKNLDTTQPARDPRVVRFRTVSPWIRIAALWAFVALGAYGLYRVMYRETDRVVTLVCDELPVAYLLPDSTNVVMNRDSKIEYRYTSQSRKVVLTGEAFFDLAPDPQRPFELSAGNLTIHDIGTSFNVKGAGTSDTIIVLVQSGMIRMQNQSGQWVTVSGGNSKAYIQSRNQFIDLMVADTNALSYKTRIFVFDNTLLETVAQKINEVYGTSLSVDSSAKACRLTATFTNESPETLISVIVETLQLKTRRADNLLILEGGDCETTQ